jgi:hypothetical protein
MTLSEFYKNGLNDYKSYKGTVHDYIDGWYNKEFTPVRNENLTIVEIGIDAGFSLRLFGEWFLNSKIIGIDNGVTPSAANYNQWINEVTNIPNTEVILSNAYTQECIDMFEDNSIDYLIDDGPHTIESQLYCIENWFPKIKKGGTLIVEDVDKIDNVRGLIDNACNKINASYEIIDLRANKNRIDDVLIIIRK